MDWSEAGADPLGDIRRWRAALERGVVAYHAVADPSGSVIFIEDEILENDEPDIVEYLYPPLCECDWNLCQCCSPDPGPEREPLASRITAATGRGFGKSTFYVHDPEPFAGLFAGLKETAERVTSSYRELGRVILETRKVPGEAGPPPPPKPVRALTSVHTPPAHRRPGHRRP